MLLFENLNQLANDSIVELWELLPFQDATALGYSLVQENHKASIEILEEEERRRTQLFPNERLSSLDLIRKEVAKPRFPNIEENQSSYIKAINKSIIIYACSIFDNFLNQSIKSLLLTHPQKIAAEKKTIPFYEFLLVEKTTIIELVIEKEIQELSYKRIDERIQDLSKRFELDLEDTPQETKFFSKQVNLNELIESFAIRNIIVHNKGIINKIFLKSVPKGNYRLGENMIIDERLFTNLIINLIKTISCIGKQIELRYS